MSVAFGQRLRWHGEPAVMKALVRLTSLVACSVLCPGAEPAPLVRIGMSSARGRAGTLERWGSLPRYLESKVPGYRFEAVPVDFDAFDAAVARRDVSFLLCPTTVYINLEARYGVTALATLRNAPCPGAVTSLIGGAILTRSETRDILRVSDLRGKRIVALAPAALGGWISALREMREEGIDPQRDLRDLRFLGSSDDVVEAVRTGGADAGVAPAGTLERLAAKRQIDLAAFRVLPPPRSYPEARSFPLLLSTRLYPEGPFVKLPHVPDDLARRVTIALLSLAEGSETALATESAGWTIPASYQSVHECMKELRLGIYRDFGTVTLRSALRQHWEKALVFLLALAGLLAGTTAWMLGLNRRLHRTHAALRKSESTFRLLVENQGEGVCVGDENQRFTFANPAADEIFGLPPGGLVGRSLGEFLPPEQVPVLLEQVEKRRAATRSVYELEIVRADGQRRNLVVTATPQLDSQGQFRGTFGIFWDITERKQAELAMADSERRYRTLFNGGVDALVVVEVGADGLPGKFLEVNDIACRRLGYSREELLQMKPSDIYAPDAISAIPAIMRRVLTDQRVVWESVIVTKDGWRIPVEISAQLSDFDGKRTYFTAVRDITDRKRSEEERARLEEQLRQAQKLESIGRLAGGVAHDFNNLLTVINGYSDLVLARLPEGALLRRQIALIRKAGERAAGLTQQLLAFGSRQMVEPKPLDLNVMVADSAEMLQGIAGEDVKLITVLGPSLGWVMADAGQIHQVLMNLVVNARHSMRKGGKLIIETANVGLDEGYAAVHPEVAPGPYVLLAVTDTGCGMDEATRQRIFEPFFTTKPMGEGTGLGLSTVYGIVRQSQGWIWVYSEPDRGTTFKIYLPRMDAGPAAAEAAESARATLSGAETVLVVEDQDEVRRLAAATLESRGYCVLEAAEGQEALSLAECHPKPIHLALIDVVLPGMNGRELAERLKTLRPEVKVLYTSGHTQTAIAQRGVLECGVAFLPKPFSSDALAAKVREVLDANSPASDAGRS